MVANDWWRDFFAGVSVDLWLQCTTLEQTRAEADFLEKALGLAPSAKVLDVPCGGGRHSIELAARGYAVTGVDLSTDFLAVARAQCADSQTPVSWEHREMRDLPWSETFDGACCFGNSFGYLDDAGNREFLKAVAKTLRPGGRFAIQTGNIAESLLPAFQERRWYEVGDIRMLIANRYDCVRSRIETDYTFVRNGQVETSQGSQGVYTYRELCSMLESAGFGELEGYSSLSWEPYHLRSSWLYLVATKTAS